EEGGGPHRDPRPHRGRLDAPAEVADGGPVGRLRRPPRRYRPAGGLLRDHHLGPARHPRQALGEPQRGGILRPADRVPRPRGEGGVPHRGAPGDDRGGVRSAEAARTPGGIRSAPGGAADGADASLTGRRDGGTAPTPVPPPSPPPPP